jgi:uncharacterized repeat protein (TIGR03806 family)
MKFLVNLRKVAPVLSTFALVFAACSGGGAGPGKQGSAGTTGSPSGGAGTTGSAAGTTGSGAGTTGSAAGTTGSAAGTTGNAAGNGGVAGAGSAAGTTGAAGLGAGGAATCTGCVEFGLQTRPANPTCVAGAPPPTAAKFVRIWPTVTFTTALDIVPHPNGTEMVVAQKDCKVIAVPKDPAATQAQARTLMTIPMCNTDVESGLLSFQFHPDFKTNGYVFAVYTRNDGMHSTRVARFKSSDAGKTIDPTTELKIWEHVQRRGTHHGGSMHFGPDGMLYVSFGDDNSGDYMDARFNDAQNPKVSYGKLFRLDVTAPPDAGKPYHIPADNPFADGAMGIPEMYARGFRNPWRFSFDRGGTHELWLADPGEEANGNKGDDGKADPYERINRIQKGKFYGWPFWQGSHCYRTCGVEKGELPEAEYSHNGGPSAIVGGFVYRGAAVPGLVGKYIHADYEHGQAYIYDPATKMRTGFSQGGKPVAFGEDLDGELYLAREGGQIEKLQNSVTMGMGGFPNLLSQTGCVLPTDATKPAAGMIPFTVAQFFWSDGAEKERFLAVPDGKTIDVAADGDMTLPPGGVTMKNFRMGGKLFETRFFVRHMDGSYYGYTYQWNAAGTDATKVPEAGLDATLSTGQAWWYPSTTGCFTCHNEAAGRSLGLETRQLNSIGTYGTAKANQFKTLDHIGLLSGNKTVLSAFPSRDDTTAPLETRARAYLAVNCANCHRPNGPGRGVWNALYDTPFKDMKICNAAPEHGDLGKAGATLLKPGMHDASLIWMRMSQRMENFMPPLASKVADTAGATLLQQWIDGTGACPQ